MFQADLSLITVEEAKIAIDRLELLKTDPGSPLAMPPRMFMDLTENEVTILIDFLKEKKGLK